MQGARNSTFPFESPWSANKGVAVIVRPGDPYQSIRTSASLEQQLEPCKVIFSNGRRPKSKRETLWFAAGVMIRAFHVIDINGIVTIEPSNKEPVFGLFACATATAPPNT